MGKQIITEIEYAYVKDYVVLKNVATQKEVEVDGEKTTVDVNNVRISITYELKDANKVLIDTAHKEHYIEVEGQQTDAQTLALVSENFEALILADKLELSGYQSEEL
jgi:acid stress-induced BolA-like protein IbaG/YrbA